MSDAVVKASFYTEGVRVASLRAVTRALKSIWLERGAL